MTNLNKFIEDELTLRKRHYKESPASIIEHYNIEQQNIQAYNGRQLLEMLQNADDASETAKDKRVLIQLIGNELIIANNGEPFNEDGFRSIMYSNLSPKVKQQNKIGQKGLGFRSILSWADEVIINSGGIKIGFSESIARIFLANLIEESPEILDFVRKHSNASYPIATLRVPELLKDDNNSDKKFDTIISIKLKESIVGDVQSQIHTIINEETLVFLNNIKIIKIDSPERKVILRKEFISCNKDKVFVKSKNICDRSKKSKTWNLKRMQGTYDKTQKNYELAIAWNENLDDNQNMLFSYFKTQVQFPFPALLHGTFELSQDRNHLEKDTDGHNKFLTEKMAELLIDTALDIARKDEWANYLPLKLLHIDFDKMDLYLQEFKFKEILIEKIKTIEIFPNVNGEYISYTDHPVYYDYPIANIIKGNDVNNLMQHCEDDTIVKFFKTFPNYYYLHEKYIAIIAERTKELEYTLLSKLYFHFLTYYEQILNSEEFNLSKVQECFLDSENKLIPWDTCIFIQPQDDRQFKLPQSLNIRFINPNLIRLLLQEFQKNDIEYLIRKLAPFKVKKYSFIEIVKALIQHYNGKERNIKNVSELHSYLFDLYHFHKNNTVEEKEILGISDIPVISHNKKIKNTNEVYFGKYYENLPIQKLYSFDKSKILASPKQFGFNDVDKDIVRRYFEWLGVATLPRYETIDLQRPCDEFNDYKEHILRNYDYTENSRYRNYNQLESAICYASSISIGYFDDLKIILEHVTIETIFKWLKCDDRLRKTLEKNNEILETSMITGNISRNRIFFIQSTELRSYTRWLFSTIAWLPVESAIQKAKPDKCCLSKTISNKFSPFVEKPKIEMATISKNLGLSEEDIEKYLVFVGVHRDIRSFSTSALYEILLSLPDRDKDGEIARSIYREIINNFDETKLDYDYYDQNYQRFIKEGKILCQKGNLFDYYPITEAYYKTKLYGNNILKKFPLVCIDRRRMNKKVKKLFGVNALDGISFTILEKSNLHPLNVRFHEEIREFKALIYALILHSDTQHKVMNRLKGLNIMLVEKLKAEFTHHQHTGRFELEQYEFIPEKRNYFYILVPQKINDIDELRQQIHFSESIAEIFTILIDTEEYRSFIRELFSTKKINREPLWLTETQKNNTDSITEAKKQLGIIDGDIRLSFWRAFSIASRKGIKTEIKNESELHTFLGQIFNNDSEKITQFSMLETFTQLDELSIQEILYKVFLEYKIDFNAFSSQFSDFDFTVFFKNEIENLKSFYHNEFAYHLYKRLEEQDVENKKRYFECLENYEDLRYDEKDGFLPDIDDYFKKKVADKLSIKLINQHSDFSFQKMITDNLALLRALLKDEGMVVPEEMWKERKDIQALILFNERMKIKEIINEQKPEPVVNSDQPSIRIRGKDIEYKDYPSLAEHVLHGLDISKIELKDSGTLPISETLSVDHELPTRTNRRKVRFGAKDKEQIGFIAELICYQKLCSEYGEENIKWISENASRAYPGKFLTGEAGKGYDLELTEDGNVRYIEIKGISDIQAGILMTANEIETALEFPDKYDLLIVENPKDPQPNLRYIRTPFKFKEKETLFSNTRFKVYNDNYIIKFILVE